MVKKIYALGFFDGVHLGHQALLRQCCALAAEQGCQTGAITFDRHPKALFSAEEPGLLTTLRQRQALLREYGMAETLVLPVCPETMAMPWQEFLQMLTEKGTVGFVCGEDFRFGAKGQGTAENLEEFCEKQQFFFRVVPQQFLDGVRISSSHIRKLLENGDVETANRFLGHPYSIGGQVMPGRQLGRTLGIPTANLWLPEGVLTPKFGVYACSCILEGKRYLAVTNIGNRPTVGGHRVTVEAWILDFTGDLYGRYLTLDFHGFLRPEKKFPSLEALQKEIQRNADAVRNRFTVNGQICIPES